MSKTNTTTFAVIAALAIGAPFEGGKFAGVTTLPDGKHVAVVLLDEKPDARMEWHDAMVFADKHEAQLPSRPIAAMLYANQRTEFERTWHWTNEQYEDDESCAWGCDFGNGYQFSFDIYYKGSVRLVRSFHIIV